jgi:hypothetical protein
MLLAKAQLLCPRQHLHTAARRAEHQPDSCQPPAATLLLHHQDGCAGGPGAGYMDWALQVGVRLAHGFAHRAACGRWMSAPSSHQLAIVHALRIPGILFQTRSKGDLPSVDAAAAAVHLRLPDLCIRHACDLRRVRVVVYVALEVPAHVVLRWVCLVLFTAMRAGAPAPR